MATYRLWGKLPWVLDKMGTSDWGVISCLGAEERALAAHCILLKLGMLKEHRYLSIKNPDYDLANHFEDRRAVVSKSFLGLHGSLANVRELDLLNSTHFDIVSFVENDVPALGQNILLDVSSLPKRFFFPILKMLRERLIGGQIRNLLVCYSVPEKYTTGRLAWNHGEWAPLPLYQGRYSRRKVEKTVASIGFETLGLTSELEEGKDTSGMAVLMLPFPAGLKWVARCWETVEKIYKARGNRGCEILWCDARDASWTFDQLEIVSNYGSREIVLAPYGPKPHSVAIALLAAKYEYPVYYNQPRHYNPEYSQGVKLSDGLPLTMAYAIGLNGRTLY